MGLFAYLARGDWRGDACNLFSREETGRQVAVRKSRDVVMCADLGHPDDQVERKIPIALPLATARARWWTPSLL